MNDDHSPVSAQQARALFADWAAVPAIVLAVSGGPDSLALLWLAARWRNARKHGPDLIAVTIDHGLRAESAREAREVKRVAGTLGVPHSTLRWSGTKPATGVPAAARQARYRLLAEAAGKHGASHVFTAHTLDDQAETVLMRMARGSGLAGLAAMTRETDRDGIRLARPLLDVPKARLLATLAKAGLGFASDPGNTDPRFARARLRALLPSLAAEGCDARNLARLASRLGRANAAIEAMVDGAERVLAARDPSHTDLPVSFFAALPEEVRLRLLHRRLNAVGHEGPAALRKVEALLASLDDALAETGSADRRTVKRTLAGAVVSLSGGRIRIEAAPRRRRTV